MREQRLRAGKFDVDVALVERPVAAQFPQWADLPIRRVDNDGWDNWLARGGVVSPAENSPQRVIEAVIAEMNV